MYGNRESCIRNDWVCLEARPAMDIAQDLRPTNIYEEQFTRLIVTTSSAHLSVTSINSELLNGENNFRDRILSEEGDTQFEVHIYMYKIALSVKDVYYIPEIL